MTLRPMVAALLLAVPAVWAEQIAPVVVTASRVAETADETLAAVTVITREDIERSQALALTDMLRALPGVSITNNGGIGKMTSVHLRGTESDHLLVLVDGIKLGSATLGQAALDSIPLAQIERVEVVRGPRSSLYGSEAIGGVIQIFTRRGQADAHAEASLTAGSFHTNELSAGLSGGDTTTWFNANVSGLDTQGFDARPEFTEPDDDGYRSLSGEVRLGHRFESGFEAELNALRAESENEFDDSFENESKTVQQVLGAQLAHDFTASWRATLLAGRANDESDNLSDGAFSSRFDTERDSASLQNDLTLNDVNLFSLGFDYLADRVDSTTDYTTHSRINRGLFAQYRTALGAHDVQAAVRGDDNSQFGYHRTGNLGWGYALKNGLRVTAAYGTAFKAPTFNDLYWPWAGNPDLSPETSHSTEFGLHARFEKAVTSVRLFRTDIANLIQWACAANCDDSNFFDDLWLPSNVASARIDGLEWELTTTAAPWQTRLAVTFLDPQDSDGNVLPRRARQSGRVDVDRDFGRLRVGTTIIAEGRRFEDAGNTKEIPGYAIMNLRTDYRLSSRWWFGARLENMFDNDYETAKGFAQPGRGIYLTASYRH